MSKVGIMSMQRIKNYGSFLQAYGLKKIIESLGHEVEFVDYHVNPSLISNNNKNGKISKLKKLLSDDLKLTHKFQYIIHKKNFDKYFSKLGFEKNSFNYNPKLDCLVIGSDEVFNCIQKNQNVGYSLELFGKDNNAKKVITYAASFGNTTIEKLNKYNKFDEIKDCICSLNAISVRDNNSFNIVSKMCDKDISMNLDPVLMYDFINECKEIPNINVKEKYMIVYAYNGRISKQEGEVIRKFAKSKNLKIYSIGGAQNCADKFIDCSPFEVLAYFKNADYVITDTFHGSIFSIITGRKFGTIVRKSQENEYGNEEKLNDLLEKFNLSNRIIYNINKIDSIINNDINYSKVQKIIEKSRKDTKLYLSSNII